MYTSNILRFGEGIHTNNNNIDSSNINTYNDSIIDTNNNNIDSSNKNTYNDTIIDTNNNNIDSSNRNTYNDSIIDTNNNNIDIYIKMYFKYTSGSIVEVCWNWVAWSILQKEYTS